MPVVVNEKRCTIVLMVSYRAFEHLLSIIDSAWMEVGNSSEKEGGEL